MDPSLPLERSGREGVRGARRGAAHQRRDDLRRAGGGRRAPFGRSAFRRREYEDKFTGLAAGVVAPAERARFLSVVDSLAELGAGALHALNIEVEPRVLQKAPAIPPGIFG